MVDQSTYALFLPHPCPIPMSKTLFVLDGAMAPFSISSCLQRPDRSGDDCRHCSPPHLKVPEASGLVKLTRMIAALNHLPSYQLLDLIEAACILDAPVQSCFVSNKDSGKASITTFYFCQVDERFKTTSDLYPCTFHQCQKCQREWTSNCWCCADDSS